GPLAAEERYNRGAVAESPGSARRRTDSPRDSHFGGRFTDLVKPCDTCSGQHGWLQSDHCFDNFVSPVTNPFLAEDPRALTEVRPIFMIQTIPNSQPLYQGGNIEFFGMRAILAVTERLSFTQNKLVGVSDKPGRST